MPSTEYIQTCHQSRSSLEETDQLHISSRGPLIIGVIITSHFFQRIMPLLQCCGILRLVMTPFINAVPAVKKWATVCGFVGMEMHLRFPHCHVLVIRQGILGFIIQISLDGG